jgi:hypothetical protein
MQHPTLQGWVIEIENAKQVTPQSPFKRAELIHEIKQRYQEQVLGIRPGGGGN